MPRLLHIADVHLGARHQDLGPAAAQQRERQFSAFRRAVDLALQERVDLVVVAGDLFDSNDQPRRSVERAAGELGRLVGASIPAVLLPGTHDCFESASIYRAFDMAALAGAYPGSDAVVVLTPQRCSVTYRGPRIRVEGFVVDGKRASRDPLAGMGATLAAEAAEHPGTWGVGVIHGSLAIPGRVEQDEVLFTEAEIARSGFDYLALGHWHSFRQGRAGRTTWAYPGAPEPVAVDQDGSGGVLIVALEEAGGERRVSIERREIGRTRFRKLQLDAATIRSQDELCRRLAELRDPDLVLDVRLVGVSAPTLEIREEEVESEVGGSFLRFRFRDRAVHAPSGGPVPPADTIAGAFLRDLETRIAAAEAAGDLDRAREYQDALHLGQLLLADPQRVTLS